MTGRSFVGLRGAFATYLNTRAAETGSIIAAVERLATSSAAAASTAAEGAASHATAATAAWGDATNKVRARVCGRGGGGGTVRSEFYYDKVLISGSLGAGRGWLRARGRGRWRVRGRCVEFGGGPAGAPRGA